MNIDAFGIDRLSIGERLELIEFIWNSLPENVDPANVPDWHLAELVKRRGEAETDPAAGRPWREVLDQLRPST